MRDEIKLAQAVIELHEIARLIEHHLGVCSASRDIRAAADKLSEIIQGDNNGIN
jgi:hypothetical protein